MTAPFAPDTAVASSQHVILSSIVLYTSCSPLNMYGVLWIDHQTYHVRHVMQQLCQTDVAFKTNVEWGVLKVTTCLAINMTPIDKSSFMDRFGESFSWLKQCFITYNRGLQHGSPRFEPKMMSSRALLSFLLCSLSSLNYHWFLDHLFCYIHLGCGSTHGLGVGEANEG